MDSPFPHIYIPTKGRINTQLTWDNLTPELRARAYLICPREEVDEHRARGRNAIAQPDGMRLAEVRDWLVHSPGAVHFNKNAPEPNRIVIADDDLIALARRRQDDWRLVGATPLQIEQLYQRIYFLLGTYPHVGVSSRAGNNRYFPLDHVMDTRIFSFHGINRDVWRRNGITHLLDPAEPRYVMEDFHAILQLLTRGYHNVLITDMALAMAPSNSPGGCSLYRTQDIQTRSAYKLAELWPDFVRVVEKKAESWQGMGVRHDVTIQWKKAAKSAQ